jgi:hypothetical protein
MSPRWTALSGTQIGSAHVREQLPLQDSHAVHVADDVAVVAVADGHGHHLHFRSDVGSRLAVAIVTDLLTDAAPHLTAVRGAEVLADVGAALVDRWTSAALEHLAQHPVDLPGSDRETRTRPYGTTVIAMVAAGDLLGVLQIGDGDAVLVTGDGRALRPLPKDPDLDGTRTTSLCQADPLYSLRSTVVDTHADGVVLGYVCTDGFSAARVDADSWWQQTGEELMGFARDRGPAWIADRLPGWLEEPARIGGDDTTLALLVRTDLQLQAPPLVPGAPMPPP